MNLFQEFTISKNEQEKLIVTFADGSVFNWEDLPATFREPVMEVIENKYDVKTFNEIKEKE